MSDKLPEAKVKAREFWIDHDVLIRSQNMCVSYVYATEVKDSVHVIEYRAYQTLERKAQKLVEALTNWLDWEKQQIEKDGPYVGKRINELINDATAKLAEYKSEG